MDRPLQIVLPCHSIHTQGQIASLFFLCQFESCLDYIMASWATLKLASFDDLEGLYHRLEGIHGPNDESAIFFSFLSRSLNIQSRHARKFWAVDFTGAIEYPRSWCSLANLAS